MKKRLILAVAFLILINCVYAVPGVPHQFYGDVIINGNPAPDNNIVTAVIEGITYTTITKNSKYGYSPIFFVEDPNNLFWCEVINFYVNGFYVKSYTFQNGKITKLDLNCTGCHILPPEPTPSNRTKYISKTRYLHYCESNWICSLWTPCIDEIMTRKCYDTNFCGELYQKPREVANCEVSEDLIRESQTEANLMNWNLIMGFMSLMISFFLIVILIILLKV